MNVSRGDVILIDYPFAGGVGTKVRPVVVILNDRDNQRLLNTVVIQITGITNFAFEPTKVLVDLATPEGQASGLRKNSLVNCVNMFTVARTKIMQKLGYLPASLMQKVNDSLKVALDLP